MSSTDRLANASVSSCACKSPSPPDSFLALSIKFQNSASPKRPASGVFCSTYPFFHLLSNEILGLFLSGFRRVEILFIGYPGSPCFAEEHGYFVFCCFD